MIRVRRCMEREPNAEASRSRSCIPSHPNSVRRKTKLGGNARQAERWLHADCGRRRAKSIRRKPSPHAMGSTLARRGKEWSGLRPGGSELPPRVVGKGRAAGPPTKTAIDSWERVVLRGHPQKAQLTRTPEGGSERVRVPYLRVLRYIACVPVPAGRVPGGIASQPHTKRTRRVRTVGIRSPRDMGMLGEVGRRQRPGRPNTTPAGAAAVVRTFEAATCH